MNDVILCSVFDCCITDAFVVDILDYNWSLSKMQAGRNVSRMIFPSLYLGTDVCDSLWSSIWMCLIQNLNWGNCHKNDVSNPLFVDINLLVFLNTFLFVRESVPHPHPPPQIKKSCHPESFDTGLLFIYTVACLSVSLSYKENTLLLCVTCCRLLIFEIRYRLKDLKKQTGKH